MPIDIDPTGSRLQVLLPDGAAAAGGAADRDPTLIRLRTAGGAEATFYPAVGFNMIDWRLDATDTPLRLIHAEPDVLSGGSGTRSGHPILFPFPNRIAGATYTWAGTTYHLGRDTPDAEHAIHGFCAKAAWTHYQQSGDSAVTAEFRLTRDAPAAAATWPGDLRLRITFDLADESMRVTSEVTNVDDRDVPFGAGFHPYFTPLAATSADRLSLQCGAESFWVLRDMIPTGEVTGVTGANDLRDGPMVGERRLDDVLTGLPPFVAGIDGLMERARLSGGGRALSLRCDAGYRDIVVFTPANRQSLAVEPYTCPTDAIHLDQAAHAVGWRVLAPGDTWIGVVEYVVV